jgi:hypothetical protein
LMRGATTVHAACAGDAATIVNPTVNAAPPSRRPRVASKFIFALPVQASPSAMHANTRKHDNRQPVPKTIRFLPILLQNSNGIKTMTFRKWI